MDYKTIADKIMEQLEDKGHCDYMANLAWRWDDEKDYEDFNDYIMAIKKRIPLTITKVTKRPFGFKFKMTQNKIAHFKLMKRNGGLVPTIDWKQ